MAHKQSVLAYIHTRTNITFIALHVTQHLGVLTFALRQHKHISYVLCIQWTLVRTHQTTTTRHKSKFPPLVCWRG